MPSPVSAITGCWRRVTCDALLYTEARYGVPLFPRKSQDDREKQLKLIPSRCDCATLTLDVQEQMRWMPRTRPPGDQSPCERSLPMIEMMMAVEIACKAENDGGINHTAKEANVRRWRGKGRTCGDGDWVVGRRSRQTHGPRNALVAQEERGIKPAGDQTKKTQKEWTAGGRKKIGIIIRGGKAMTFPVVGVIPVIPAL